MDPISTVIAALTAGAVAAGKDTAQTAVKDAYEGLKTLIKHWFAAQGKKEDSDIIDKCDKKLDSKAFQELLREELASLKIEQEPQIIQKSQELLKQTETQDSPTTSKYNAVFQGEVKGAQIGDGNTQTNTFN